MIQIQLYREFLNDLIHSVNQKADDKIQGVNIAVNEAHMTKKLRDCEGVWLCANYPDADFEGDYDTSTEGNKVLLFLVEKVNSGHFTEEDEIQHYAKLQGIASRIKEHLLLYDSGCLSSYRFSGSMTIEWEYDIFGGFNGLSLGFKLFDYDRTDY